MEQVHIETTVRDGRIVIDDLPFGNGEKVKVAIEGANRNHNDVDPYSLRGTPYRYDDPFEPVCPPEEWEALR